jgi:PmbA protein
MRMACPTSPFGLDRQQLESLVATALDEAGDLGADQAEAGASLGTGMSVMVRCGEVETIEHQRDRSFAVTVYFEKRKGHASTSDLSVAAIHNTVKKACSIAGYTADDECAGLADADQMASAIPDLSLDHEWDLSPEDAIALATECEQHGMSCDQRIDNSDGSTVHTGRALKVYGNTHGFRGGFPSSSHSLSCVLVAKDGERMERDYWYTSARDPAELETAISVGQRAAERTVSRLGSRKITTRTAPVLFPAELARGLFGHFVAAIRGASQYRKSTFLLDAAGSEVFPAFINISERPHIPGAAASAPFDSEGVATRDRELVRDGVLESYVLGSYSARKLGLQTTGNAGGIHNLVVSHGEKSFEDLVAELNTGLIVNELMGQGVNGVTGDYSRGVSGFWVENGEIAYPVTELTIAGNLKSMFQDIVAVSSDVDLRGGIRTGSLLIGEMTIAGD